MTRDNFECEPSAGKKEFKEEVLEEKITLKEGFFDLPGDQFLALLDQASAEELESMLDMYGKKSKAPVAGSGVSTATLSDSTFYGNSALPDKDSILSIVFWWELRRPIYNLLVGLCGLLALIALSVLNHAPPEFLLFGAFSYFVTVNVFYTTVWVLHILVRCLAGDQAGVFGRRLFVVATAFSVLTTLAIAVLLPITYLITGGWI